MYIEKILNNNVVISKNTLGKEVVVMGRGIAFQCKKSDLIDDSKIDKTFIIKTNNLMLDKYQELLAQVSHEEMLATEMIIELASHELSNKLHTSIRLSLADHLHYAIERCKQGSEIKNALLWEIKKFYQAEFKLGIKALAIIKQQCQVELCENEAGFIALHLVNSQLNDDMHNTMDITSLIHDIAHLVKYYFKLEIDDDKLSYHRFITHLKFLGHRLIHESTVVSDDDSLYISVKEKYAESFVCTVKVAHMIDVRYTHKMTNEEMMFMTIHIERVRRDHC